MQNWTALVWNLVLACSFATVSWAQAIEGASGSSPMVTYEQVRVVLRKHCVSCHNQDELRGGLDLASQASIQAGSDSGPVVSPGRPEESLLYLASAHQTDPKMPPNKPKIAQRELDLLRRWISGGMPAGKSTGSPQNSLSSPIASSSVARPSIAPSTFTSITPLQAKTAITALAMNSQGSQAAVSGMRQVVLLDLKERKWINALDFPEGEITALKYSIDGSMLVAAGGVGGLSGTVVGFSMKTGQRLFRLADETDTILAMDLSSDGKWVAVGGPNRNAKIYGVEDAQQVHTMRWHTDWVLSVAFSPDGLLLASGDRFGGLRVWEAATGKEFHTLRGHTDAVTNLLWSQNSEQLVSASLDGTLRIWDMHHAAQLRTKEGDSRGILALAGQGPERFILGGRSKMLKVFGGGQIAINKIEMEDEIVKLATDTAGSHALAGDAAGNLALLRIDQFGLGQRPPIDRITLPIDAKLADAFAQKIASLGPEVEESQSDSQTYSPSQTLDSQVTENDRNEILVAVEQALQASLAAQKSAEQALDESRRSIERLQNLIQQLRGEVPAS